MLRKKELSDDEFSKKFVKRTISEFEDYENDLQEKRTGLFIPIRKETAERAERLLETINNLSEDYRFEITCEEKTIYVHIIRK